MSRWVAFLRAINVGGHNIKMGYLRQLFESLGFVQVETYIASGNVVFEATGGDASDLEKKIEMMLGKALGYEVPTFIRSEAELAAVAAYVPFQQADLEKAEALNVAFLHSPLEDGAVQKLMALRTDIDDFHSHGRQIYWLCRKKQSESTFSNAVLEKTLGVQSTLRGMNTIKKMAAKYVLMPHFSQDNPSIELIIHFNDALNAQDVDTMMMLMADDCVFENTYPPPNRTRYVSQAAVRAFWEEFFRISHQPRFEIEEIFPTEVGCVMRWVYHWVDAQGRPGHVRGVDIYKIIGGKIIEKLSYVKG